MNLDVDGLYPNQNLTDPKPTSRYKSGSTEIVPPMRSEQESDAGWVPIYTITGNSTTSHVTVHQAWWQTLSIAG